MVERKSRETANINKSFVDAVSVSGLYLDTTLTGFRLKVTDTGTKVYLVYGKVRGDRNAITVTIGRHGERAPDGTVWTSVKARARAEQIRGMMRSGVNPNLEDKKLTAGREAERAVDENAHKLKGITLRKVFCDYVVAKQKTESIKESTAYVYQCDIFKCLVDWLDKPLVDIMDEDVVKRHCEIGSKHKGQANHVMRILRALFYFAMEEYKTSDGQPLITRNPVRAFSKKKHWNKLAPRDRIIREYQLEAFFKACQSIEHPTASDYLPFLILTGLRAEEAASLTWDSEQIDFKLRIIRVFDTKNGREHRLPMTDYLYALLKTRWQLRTGPYVFPGANVDAYMSDFRHQTDKVVCKCRQLLGESLDEEVREQADKFDFTPHDLRRTFATTAAQLLPDYVVKRLLNHINSADVTQAHYLHAELEKLREPMLIINEVILKAAGLIARKEAPIPRRATKVRTGKKNAS